MKKTIELSVIAGAIEMATSEWHQFYHMGTGEVRSLPDEYSGYMDADEYEREAEEIDESPDFVRLPDQRDRDDYSIMEAFAEAVDREELFRALRGRRPFRSFKDCAIRLGLIEAYYAYHGGACTERHDTPALHGQKRRSTALCGGNACLRHGCGDTG